jgi:hypothetical protein
MADVYTDIINGNDSTGDGSAGTPYQTIQKAFDEANGGDTVWIGDSGINTLSAQLDWVSFGTAQGTSVDNRLCVRGWDYSGGAGADGVAVINGNSLAGILAATKNYVTWYHLEIYGTDGASHYGLDLGSGNIAFECDVHDVTGTNAYAIGAVGDSQTSVVKCRVDTVVHGIYAAAGGGVVGCVIMNGTGRCITGSAQAFITGNVAISAGGTGVFVVGDGNLVINNTLIGDGSTSSIHGVDVASNSEGIVIWGNVIKGWSGTSNTGVNNASGNAIAVLGGNHYADNTLDESASISDDCDIYLAAVGAGAGFVTNVSGGGGGGGDATEAKQDTIIMHLTDVKGTGFVKDTDSLPQCLTADATEAKQDTIIAHLTDVKGTGFVKDTDSLPQCLTAVPPTAGAIADAVHDEALADHTAAGTAGERLGRIPNAAAGGAGGVLTADANNRVAGIVGTVVNTLDEIAGAAYVEGTNALDQVAAVNEVWEQAGAEPTTMPAGTASMLEKIDAIYAYAVLHSKNISNSTGKETLRNEADSADLAQANVSDDGTTFTRGKMADVP